MSKKQITVEIKNITLIIAMLLLPVFATLVLQHFGKFSATYRSNVTSWKDQFIDYKEITVETQTFHTFFGDTIIKNVRDKNILAYENGDRGKLIVAPTYINRVPFYLKAVVKDIFVPLSFSFVLITVFIFNKFFTIKLKY